MVSMISSIFENVHFPLTKSLIVNSIDSFIWSLFSTYASYCFCWIMRWSSRVSSRSDFPSICSLSLSYFRYLFSIYFFSVSFIGFAWCSDTFYFSLFDLNSNFSVILIKAFGFNASA